MKAFQEGLLETVPSVTTVYLIPIVGVFALGETLKWQTLVALALILLGIALVNGSQLPRKPVVKTI